MDILQSDDHQQTAGPGDVQLVDLISRSGSEALMVDPDQNYGIFFETFEQHQNQLGG